MGAAPPGQGGLRAEVTGAGSGDVITAALFAGLELHWRRHFAGCCGDRGLLSGAPCAVQAACEAVRPQPAPERPRLAVVGCQPAGLAALSRGERLLRAMSRPSSVSPRPPAPGGGGGGPAPCCPGGGGRAKGLKDIRIDEEVKIAVNIALERFRYGDQRGEVPDRDPAGCPTSRKPGPSVGRGCLTRGREDGPARAGGRGRRGRPLLGCEEPQSPAGQPSFGTLRGVRKRKNQVAP